MEKMEKDESRHGNIAYNLRVISFKSNFNLTCDTLDATQVWSIQNEHEKKWKEKTLCKPKAWTHKQRKMKRANEWVRRRADAWVRLLHFVSFSRDVHRAFEWCRDDIGRVWNVCRDGMKRYRKAYLNKSIFWFHLPVLDHCNEFQTDFIHS